MARRVLLGVALVLVVGVATAMVIARRDDGSAGAATAKSTTTARVSRRTLVRSQTVAGTLDFGEAHPIAGGRAGTVTSVAPEGTTVSRGQPLFAVDREPTILLLGSLPMYRDLAAGVDDGPDVQQLEQNLAALGFTDDGALTVDQHFSSTTTAAVEAWQDALGVEATGKVARGDVVFQPAAVRVSTVSAEVGASVQAEATVVEVTPRTQVVRLGLDTGQADLGKVGAAAQITLPNGRTTTGKVTAVADAAPASGGNTQASTASSSNSSTAAVVDVTVGLDDPKAVAGYTTASVDVAFTTERKDNVLAVPVTALLALAGGGYGVEVPQPGGTTKLVVVQAGMYADGYVEVSGVGDGTSVVVAK